MYIEHLHEEENCNKEKTNGGKKKCEAMTPN